MRSPKRKKQANTIERRLQILSCLTNDVSIHWTGHNTLEEIKFQRGRRINNENT